VAMYACTPVVEADYDGDRIPWEYALDVLAQERGLEDGQALKLEVEPRRRISRLVGRCFLRRTFRAALRTLKAS